MLRASSDSAKLEDAVDECLNAKISEVPVSRLSVGFYEFAPCEIESGGIEYTLRISYVGTDSIGHAISFVAAVEARVMRVPAATQLETSLGLTPQQGRVARCLALGRSNSEIANELSISPHTARRHTEQVLRKLGIKSRSEVARVVTRYVG